MSWMMIVACIMAFAEGVVAGIFAGIWIGYEQYITKGEKSEYDHS